MGQSSSHTIATQLLSSPVGSVSSYGGSWSQTAGSHGRCGHLVGLILPLEIWDEIIDYFGEAGDRLTLSSCALVCRAWLPRARSHLFRVIYVHTPRHLRRLTKALDRSPEIPPLIKDYTLCPDEEAAEVVSRGLKLLSRLPQVIEVTISPSHLCPDTVAGLLPPLKLMPVPSSVRGSRHRPHARLIELKLTMQIYTLNRHINVNPSVTSLTLSLITFLDFSDLAKLLCELPNLLYLRCGDVKWVISGYNPLRLEQHRDVVLKRLTDLGLSSNVFLESGLRFVLDAVGPALRRFTFAVEPKESTQSLVARNLDLGRFPHLESVELGNWIHSPEWDFDWIPTALETISSNELSRICLKYPLYSTSLSRPDALTHMSCPRLEEVLLDQRFATIQEIVFQFEDVMDHHQWWSSQLAARMPALYSRNIMQVKLRSRAGKTTWREGWD